MVSTECQLFADPADLFVSVFDWLGEAPFQAREADHWLGDPAVWTLARAVQDDVLDVGQADLSRIRTALRSRGAQGAFGVLLGLDEALAYAHPDAGNYGNAAIYALTDRYLQLGRLNTESVRGLLLFRTSFPGRPRGLPSRASMFGLVRVASPKPGAALRWVEGAFDLVPEFDADGEFIAIGCVPFLEHLDDVHLVAVETRLGVPGYRLAPASTAALRHRVANVLEALDNANVLVGVIPEGCLSDELYVLWQEALRSTLRRPTKLAWLLVGSGPLGNCDPPRNRAVILHRSGRELSAHDKMYDFTITGDQISRWGLDGILGSENLVEDIQLGNASAMLESRAGRFCVLICEDLARVPQEAASVGDFGVSHVLVPIFSDPCGEHSWATKAGTDYAQAYGSHVVVSNSLVIARSQRRVTDRERGAIVLEDALEEPPKTSCAIGPPLGLARYSWTSVPELMASSSAVDVQCFRVPTALFGRRWIEFESVAPSADG
jgi:predicted amidohydrolase